jgi:hypothetical protein
MTGPMRASATYLILDAIGSTPIPRLLSERPAVVLERIARGGGATQWYHLEQTGDLVRLVERLTPGSAVSFYFDGRIERRFLDENLVDVVLDLIRVQREAVVVGMLSTDRMAIDVEFVAGLGDLSEFLGATLDGVEMFVGAFPARDDDGKDAVTIDLPDPDGVVRRHPH